ncbi:MAG: DUF4476 domain-containing protein [Lentimicrobiaceae bacterium]|nr:DUF4476 domain-containing protein [Lentimicrobiaceae bacterium]
MKKIFLFFVVSLISSTLFAQFSSITVSSNSNQKFWLFIDDVLQNEYSTHIIRIQGLQYTYYKVRVEMDNAANSCVGQNVLISGISSNNNYIISRDKGNNFRFEKTNIAVNPYFIQTLILPDYSCFSAYNQFLFPGFNTNANYGQNQFKGSAYKKYQYDAHGHGYGGNQGYGNQSGPGNQPGHGNQPGYGNQSGYGNQPGHGNPGHGNPPQSGCMHPNDFNRAFNSIQKESFENSKLDIAKQITSNNWLCVSQIVQICNLFSFENSKLEYAKYAYRYCVDKNNYFQLNDVFSFSTSKDELRKYINNTH